MSRISSYAVHAEPRAGHWVAWVTAHQETRPAGAVILVGQTQEEAEANARRWGERLVADTKLLRP